MSPPSIQSATFQSLAVEGQNNQIIINQNATTENTPLAVKQRPFNPATPYLGLKRFRAQDRRLFFGREALTRELLSAVREHSFTFVAGASGSGKSSLVRAGLVPVLVDHFGPRLRVLTLTPGKDPYRSLRDSLRSEDYSDEDADQALAAVPETLLRLALTVREPDQLWFILLDQFEELFTLCTDEVKRASFISGVVRLVQAALPEVRIVAVMRSDFFDRFGPHPELARLVEENLRFVADLTPSELQAAIEQPAAHHGVVYEDGLTAQIIADIKDQPGALPLLQYTLDLLWKEDKPDDRCLNTETYQRIGGVKGALRERADLIFRYSNPDKKVPRSPDEQTRLRRIFLRLVSYSGSGEQARPVSKRTPLAEFRNEGEFGLVLELIKHGLLISDQRESDAAAVTPTVFSRVATLELAHEALLEAWEQLKAWVEAARGVLSVHARLAGDAARWQALLSTNPKGAEAELWSGTFLQRALEMRTQGDFDSTLRPLTEVEDAFLSTSDELREQRELVREEQRLRRVQALQRELDGYVERGRLLSLADQPIAALASLLQAHERRSEHKMLPYLLRQAVVEVERVQAVLVGHRRHVRAIDYSPDGRLLFTAGDDGTAQLWDAISGQPIRGLIDPISPEARIQSAELSPCASQALTVSADGVVRIWDVGTGALLHRLGGRLDAIVRARFSLLRAAQPKALRVVAARQDGTVAAFCARTGTTVKELGKHTGPIVCLDVSNEGKLAVSGGQDGVALLWDLDAMTLRARLAGHKGAVGCAVFSGDGTQVLTADEDQRVHLWHALTGTRRIMPYYRNSSSARLLYGLFSADGSSFLAVHEDAAFCLRNIYRISTSHNEQWERESMSLVTAVAASPDGFWVAMAHQDGLVRLHSLLDDSKQDTLRGPLCALTALRFSPCGQLIAAGAEDGTTWIWQVSPPQLRSECARAGYQPKDLLVSGDGTITLTRGRYEYSKYDHSKSRLLTWDLQRGRMLAELSTAQEPSGAIALSANGSTVLVVYPMGAAEVFSARTGARLVELPAPAPQAVKEGTATSEKDEVGAALSPDGSHAVIYCGRAALIASWNDGLVCRRLAWEQSIINQVALSPLFGQAIILRSGCILKFYDLATGDELGSLRIPVSSQWTRFQLRVSEDGAKLLVSSRVMNADYELDHKPGFACVLDLATKRVLAKVESPAALSASLSADGRLLLVVKHGELTAQVLDSESGELLHAVRLNRPESRYQAKLAQAKFSPDGLRLLTDSATRYGLLRQMDSGKELAVVSALLGETASDALFFGAASVVFLSGGVVQVWDANAEERDHETLKTWLRNRIPYSLDQGRVMPTNPALPAVLASNPIGSAAIGQWSERRSCLNRGIFALQRRDVDTAARALAAAAEPLQHFDDQAGLLELQVARIALARLQSSQDAARGDSHAVVPQPGRLLANMTQSCADNKAKIAVYKEVARLAICLPGILDIGLCACDAWVSAGSAEGPPPRDELLPRTALLMLAERWSDVANIGRQALSYLSEDDLGFSENRDKLFIGLMLISSALSQEPSMHAVWLRLMYAKGTGTNRDVEPMEFTRNLAPLLPEDKRADLLLVIDFIDSRAVWNSDRDPIVFRLLHPELLLHGVIHAEADLLRLADDLWRDSDANLWVSRAAVLWVADEALGTLTESKTWAERLYAAAQTLPDGKSCEASFQPLRDTLAQLSLAPERAAVARKVLELLEQPMTPVHRANLGILLGAASVATGQRPA